MITPVLLNFSVRDVLGFAIRALAARLRVGAALAAERAVYTPATDQSPIIKKSVAVGIELPEFLDRMIIGPTQFAAAMYDAFGMTDLKDKIFVSNIPIRT
jgi:hypothetical protein